MQLEIKRTSWVLKVAGYGGLSVEDRTDLCSVFWCFLWGMVRAPFWVALVGVGGAVVIVGAIGLPVVALLAYFLEGLPIWPGAWLVMILETTAVCFLLYVLGKADPIIAPMKQFAAAGYRSWKDKTCVFIDIKEA
jgi:hypothetical protein